jgi:hypothetical protein
MTDPTATAAAVHAVSLKLLTFLASQPDVWFQQAEAQCALHRIADSTTHYYYLLTALDPVVAERMAGVVANTPVDGKYAYLKRKLLEVNGLTDDQKADRLLELVIENLLSFALLVDKDVLLRRIFLRQLPKDVRVQVVSLEESNLQALARKADVIVAAKQAPALVYASTQAPSMNPPSGRSDKATFCWYHAKFGTNAKSCRPLCAYSASSVEQQSRPVGLTNIWAWLTSDLNA